MAISQTEKGGAQAPLSSQHRTLLSNSLRRSRREALPDTFWLQGRVPIHHALSSGEKGRGTGPPAPGTPVLDALPAGNEVGCGALSVSEGPFISCLSLLLAL